MPTSPFAFTPDEELALEKLLDRYPQAAALEKSIDTLLERLARTFQGMVTTEELADYVLAGLRDRIVAKSMSETDGWDEAEDLRGAAIDLLVRHYLARAREDFIETNHGAEAELRDLRCGLVSL